MENQVSSTTATSEAQTSSNASQSATTAPTQQSVAPQGQANSTQVDNGQAGQAQPQANQQQNVQGQVEQAPNVSKFDEATSEWLRSKGYDANNLDVNKIISSYQNAEKALTQAFQERAKQPTQQMQQLPVQQDPSELVTAQPTQEMSPLEEFEALQNYQEQLACAYNGVADINALRQTNPELYDQLWRNRQEGQQKAFFEMQAWKEEQNQKAIQKQQAELAFKNQMNQAESAMKANLLNLSNGYPELQAHFDQYGINKLLNHFEDQWAVPRELILSNPEFANLLATATRGMHLLKNLDSHDQEVKNSYDKELKNQKQAVLPGATLGQDSAINTFAKFAQKVGSGVSITD